MHWLHHNAHILNTSYDQMQAAALDKWKEEMQRSAPRRSSNSAHAFHIAYTEHASHKARSATE